MALKDQAALAADATFQSQVRMAALNRASSFMQQAATVHNISDTKYWALAQAVLADGCVTMLPRFAWAIAAFPNFPFVIATPPTAVDADVITAVNNIWSRLAGITPADAVA